MRRPRRSALVPKGTRFRAVENAVVDTDDWRRESGSGSLSATGLADLLVDAGVPFRDAHTLVGRAVDRAVDLGVELPELPTDEWQHLLPQLEPDKRKALSLQAVLDRRAAIGGTAPSRVASAGELWRTRPPQRRDDLAGDGDMGCEERRRGKGG